MFSSNPVKSPPISAQRALRPFFSISEFQHFRIWLCQYLSISAFQYFGIFPCIHHHHSKLVGRESPRAVTSINHQPSTINHQPSTFANGAAPSGHGREISACQHFSFSNI